VEVIVLPAAREEIALPPGLSVVDTEPTGLVGGETEQEVVVLTTP
jgi:hypothetical protein